jgi:hypothetical protein
MRAGRWQGASCYERNRNISLSGPGQSRAARVKTSRRMALLRTAALRTGGHLHRDFQRLVNRARISVALECCHWSVASRRVMAGVVLRTVAQLMTDKFYKNEQGIRSAKVAELADAPDLGSGGETHGGSSPPFRTNLFKIDSLDDVDALPQGHCVLQCE